MSEGWCLPARAPYHPHPHSHTRPPNTTNTTTKQNVLYQREGLKPLTEPQRQVFDFVVVRLFLYYYLTESCMCVCICAHTPYPPSTHSLPPHTPKPIIIKQRHFHLPPDLEASTCKYGPLSGRCFEERAIAAYRQGLLPAK